ncbi:hypothetical protein [Micromonospora sp. WMMD980]|uniref:hypothetical protein n=1 Tax=Micromonospora sp. WMMD980 TaxID=3016088 RepID=UPI00241704C7|nr:hypothetical protein [Micromonospora sp. WMMD980]MDG4804582.1 hypothetical protein [Micromonospora sp. WMMD980]
MSEAGQPGAATPGEHGDGTGQQDDPARTGGGWAPPADGWSRGAPAPGGWPYGDLGGGWAASSPRHGDLPAPLPGHAAEEPPRVNGRHVNGVRHAGEESPVTRQAPVSAPPVGEPPRENDGDRLAVPAPRPAPAVEQQPDAAASRHASDDTAAGRLPRWAESGPTSAPPALQVPPVGAAASGFEVPPGFHAPTVDPAAPSLSRGWADRGPVEPAAAGDRAEQPSPEPPAQHPADRRATEGARAAVDPRGAGADDPGEPDWSGPSWNRPSWGDGWAPPWARTDEPAGRRAGRDDEPSARRAVPDDASALRRAGREDEPADRAPQDDEPTGRRAGREDRAAEWAPEPVRPYEPVRVEPPTGYEPPRPEPVRPYEPVRAESAAGHETPRPEPTRPFRLPREDPEPRPAHESTAQRPSWAGPPVPVTPFGARPDPPAAPPAAREAPAGPPPPAAYAPAPAARAAGEPADEPHRAPDQAPAEPAGVPPVSAAPAPFDSYRPPRPTSAPPYAARRSAPEPAPTAAAPVAESPSAEPAPAVLPQRVPAEPDVPVVPEPPAVEPSAETPELARIATHLRRDDEPAPLRERPEGFDVNAILDAVREVAGVRDAALRRTPAGAHSLRLDLADGADPADVSRLVARLLQERMGLAAAPQNLPGAPAVPPPPVRRRSAAARADRLAELPPPDPRSGTPRSRADDEPDAQVTGAVPPGPAGDDTSARPGVMRPANRPAENRSGEGRFGGVESRTGRPADTPVESAEPGGEPPRRRRQSTHRGRATVDETSLAAAPTGMSTGSPVTLGTSYSGGQMTTTETAPSRPLDPGGAPGPRVVIDHVLVSTFGLDATTEVRLLAGDRAADGHATGPAVDGYVLRLCAVAAAAAVDELLGGGDVPAGDRGRCFVEHAAVVPFGNCEVATVVVLLVCEGWVEQLAGSALVAGDPRQAVVRATLAAVNRRLEALLA